MSEVLDVSARLQAPCLIKPMKGLPGHHKFTAGEDEEIFMHT